MHINLFKILSISSFFLLSFIFAPIVSAELYTSGENGEAILIADVALYNATLVTQEENKLNLSFEIANKEGSQAGLHYEIKLIKETKNKGQFIVDKYVSPEIFNLSSNQSLLKEVEYTAPNNLSGVYKVLISLNNTNGTMLALGFTKNVELKASINFLVIQTESCYLTVKDEKNNPKYNLLQGVDIDEKEELILNCNVLNETENDITAKPTYKTYLRTTSGEVVEDKGGELEAILFKKGENQKIALTLPKALKPQAYDIAINLNDTNESNKVIAHYVIRGASATIQNFSIDKEGNKKGDIVKMNLSWTPSADSFSGNRLGNKGTLNTPITLSLVMTQNNKDCINPINQIIEHKDSGIVNLQAELVKKCNSPIATITLKDDKGEVLDSKELLFNTENKDKNNYIIYIIFGLLIVLGLVYYFINLNKKENETTI